MASFEDLLQALAHIEKVTGDPNAWQRGLSVQDIRDVNGWINASRTHDGNSYRDEDTGIWYRGRNTSDTADHPQVLDSTLGAIRNNHPGLFSPSGELVTPPQNPAPAPPGDKPVGNPADRPAQPPAGAPGEKPGGPAGALPAGEEQAGKEQDDAGKEAAGLDESVSKTLDQVLKDNADARKKAENILAEIESRYYAMAPEMGDPAALSGYQQFLRGKLDELEKVLSDAKVDSTTKEALLNNFAEHYRRTGPQTSGDNPGTSGTPGGDDDGGTTGNGGDDLGQLGGDDGGLGLGDDEALFDPLAGLGMTGADPLSSLASALPGLASLPGQFTGGGGSPFDGLGAALGSLGSTIPGLANLANDGFKDDKAPTDADEDEFSDDEDEKKDEDQDDEHDHDEDDKAEGDEEDDKAGGPAAAEQPGTPDAVAPETAPDPAAADVGTTVTLPDGQQVDAGSKEAKAVMNAVMAGASVPDAFREAADVQLPPPGTPVTSPVPPGAPGTVGHFQSRDPILAMGNNKVWLDGQVQPISVLGSSSDFMGWSNPLAGKTPASAVAK